MNEARLTCSPRASLGRPEPPPPPLRLPDSAYNGRQRSHSLRPAAAAAPARPPYEPAGDIIPFWPDRIQCDSGAASGKLALIKPLPPAPCRGAPLGGAVRAPGPGRARRRGRTTFPGEQRARPLARSRLCPSPAEHRLLRVARLSPSGARCAGPGGGGGPSAGAGRRPRAPLAPSLGLLAKQGEAQRSSAEASLARRRWLRGMPAELSAGSGQVRSRSEAHLPGSQHH